MKKLVEQRNYVDWGCGFPVTLARVTKVPWGKDDAIALVPYDRLETEVLRALVDKPTRLTGKEVRFIRIELDMRLVEFGQAFDVTHAAVKKWESKGDSATGMGWGTEAMIRLYVLERTGAKLLEIAHAYKRLTAPRLAGPCAIHLDLDQSPAAIRYEEQALAEVL